MKIHNFNPGPAALPKMVLAELSDALVDFKTSGMSILAHSHRASVFQEVHEEAIQSFRDLLNLPEEYHVLLLQGGASLQFAMVPMNLLAKNQTADYVITGVWSQKAFGEAKRVASAREAATSQDRSFCYIPRSEDIRIDAAAQYLHITTNNTIYGTQWRDIPEESSVPLIADMSSDILSRELDVKNFSLFYCGAQKNLGPAGLTVVVIREELLKKCQRDLSTILSYVTHVDSNSLYNTPPVFAVYAFGRVMNWLKSLGGVPAIARMNREKADTLYRAIDESEAFYLGTANKKDRSMMNVTFRLPNDVLEQKFIEESIDAGFVGLKGHRLVGGCRVSLYNAVLQEDVQALVSFMHHFRRKYS
jgi:phosphoserine aminotransferase